MARRITKTSDEIGTIHIEQAARPLQKPPVGAGDDFRRDHLLYQPRPVETVRLPEPVDRAWVGWRRTKSWERPLVAEARLRERRAELSMFDGLIG